MSGVKAPRSLRMASLAAASFAAVGAAHAAEGIEADAPGALPEVVVTGEREREHPYADPNAPYKTDRSASGKLTEPLLDTPKSVTVISEQAITDSGALTFRDLARTQPGVTLGTGEGGNAFGDRVFIRGFDARNDVYVDGVRDPGVGSREIFAVEQIEIFKGPNSAFGGRGTTGGAISLVSKAPQPSGDFGDLELTVGTEETRRATFDVNKRLGPDVTVRLNGMVHEGGVAGRDYVFNDRWGVAAAVLYRPTEALSLSADYFHLTTDELPDWGVPYDAAANRPFQVDRDNYYGVLSRDFRDTFADVYTVKGEYRVSPDLSFRSLLRYGQSKNAYTASAPEQPNAVARTVRANAKRRDAVTDYLVSQTDATWRFRTGGIEHALVAGLEFSRENVLNRARAFTECATLPCSGAASNPTLDLDRPNNAIAWPAGSAVTGRTEIEVDNQAAYVLDTVKLGDRWQLFGALRFDAYDVGLSQLTYATQTAPQSSTTRSSSSDFWSWQVGAVYKPAANGSVYVSYSTASNPPGEQLDATAFDYGGLDARTVDLDPAENRSLELGTKWNVFGERLSLTAAVFRIERDKVPVAVGATVVPAQEQKVDGLELGFSGNVTPRWSLFGGLTVLDTEITASPVAVQVGTRFANVPETSFALTSRHQLTDRVHVGGTAVYNSERYERVTAAVPTSIDAFWRYDLFGGVKLTDRMELNFTVLNVADELYYDALYRSATPFTYVAPGRSAMVTLDVDF